jgi:hypothetical protein
MTVRNGHLPFKFSAVNGIEVRLKSDAAFEKQLLKIPHIFYKHNFNPRTQLRNKWKSYF